MRTRRDAIADHVEAGDGPMLEQPDASRSEHVDQRVHEAARIGGPVAREHEPGADVARQCRHEAPDIAPVQQRPGTGNAECIHLLQLGVEALGQPGVVERDDDLPARGHLHPARRQAVEHLGLAADERREGGPPGLELPRRGRPHEPDPPAGHRRDRAWADAQRAVSVHQCSGGVAEHAGPRQRRQQRRAEEAGVASGGARAQRGSVDDRDLGAALVQRERAGQADQTSADDEDRCRRHGAGRYSGPASGGPEE